MKGLPANGPEKALRLHHEPYSTVSEHVGVMHLDSAKRVQRPRADTVRDTFTQEQRARTRSWPDPLPGQHGGGGPRRPVGRFVA